MSKNTSFEFLKPFLNNDGISGHENKISETFKQSAKKVGAKISRDGFGSVIATLGNKGPKVMIAAHMDEVGFLVQLIEKNGFIRMSPVGGHWPHTMLANRVKVVTNSGKEYHGTIGSTSVHVLQPEQRTKVLEFKDMYVDLGFGSAEAVEKAGIEIGDQIINLSEAVLLGDNDKYVSKAIDNRVGVAIAARVLERLKDETLKCQLFAVATAQEEVGLRGAKTATSMLQPDLAIAIDTTVSHDTPGIIPGGTSLGAGAVLAVKDYTALANPKLVAMLIETAKKHKIKVYKFVSQGGGNDTGETQFSKAGIPAITLCIPTRYLHTPSEVSSLSDFEATVELIVNFIKELTPEKYESLLYK